MQFNNLIFLFFQNIFPKFSTTRHSSYLMRPKKKYESWSPYFCLVCNYFFRLLNYVLIPIIIMFYLFFYILFHSSGLYFVLVFKMAKEVIRGWNEIVHDIMTLFDQDLSSKWDTKISKIAEFYKVTIGCIESTKVCLNFIKKFSHFL